MVATALAGLSAAAAIGGTALNFFGSKAKDKANAQSSYYQYLISQEQVKGSNLQKENAANLATAQITLADIQREQNQLGIKTQKDVIGQQMAAEDVRRQQNEVSRGENLFKLDATIKSEALAEQNDVLNRTAEGLTRQGFQLESQKDILNRASEQAQRNIYGIERVKDDLQRQNDQIQRRQDVQDRQMEYLQGQAALLTNQRQQRQIIRQGIAERSSAVAQASNKGVQAGSTLRSAVSNQAQSKAREGLAASGQDYAIQTALMGAQTEKRELGVQSRELGVLSREQSVLQRGQQEQQFEYGTQSRELGVQQRLLTNQQFELGTQSRELGVQGRKLSYGVAVNSFNAANQQALLTNQLFDINKSISQTYLNAQDLNSALVNRSYDANAALINANRKATQDMAEVQAKVFALGGNINLANMQGASSGSLAALGTGLLGLGSALGKNTEGFGKASDFLKNLLGGGGMTGSINPDGTVGEQGGTALSQALGVEGVGVYQ